MGVPNSEVDYTFAMPRREDHEVHRDMWGHWEKKTVLINVRLSLMHGHGLYEVSIPVTRKRQRTATFRY